MARNTAFLKINQLKPNNYKTIH